jgi:cytochrome c553
MAGSCMRWRKFAAAAGLLIVVGLGGAYARSESLLRRAHALPATDFSVGAHRVSLDEGRRLATVYGCYAGCHGSEGQGGVMFDEPAIARVVAPDLRAAVRRLDDSALSRAIRAGLHPDGRSMLVMPADAYAVMSDEELANIVAFFRSLPATEGASESTRLGPLGRLGVLTGEFRTKAETIAVQPPLPPAVDAASVRGRYLAQVACAHCHGAALDGASNPHFTSPPLAVIAGYSPDEFRSLLRTGVTRDGRTTPVMTGTSRKHLQHLTDDEIASLDAYLRSLVRG